MRLLIVGALDGLIVEAGKLALARGAKVAHVETIEGALTDLRAGKGADLVMMDVSMDIGRLVKSLSTERINCPIVACGIGETPHAAANAIKAGAKEYIPLPPDSELIAAILLLERVATMRYRLNVSSVCRFARHVALLKLTLLLLH